ncbi:glycosyltransferase [Zoogloea sp.]|uniref:glycosyltransferase n=1 Tax=Zoogloea sp. TaxID=49181 RepID=UPI0035B0F0A3
MRQLFSAPRRPYYIEAPAYRRTSAGIRVLHLLCHALNGIGEEAYLYPTDTNPLLNTPLVTPELIERHKAAGREPIVVYPEVVPGNPRNAASVVRYVLNRAGLLGGDSVYADTELIFGFGLNALPEGADPQNILFLPPIDTALFNNLNNPHDTQRSGSLLYPGRHQAALSQYPRLAAEATLITYSWPESHEALAALLRRSEVVYCFESTAIAAEAALCGCPAVILPSPFFNGVALSEAEIGRNGIALNDSPEEVAFARRTVGLMWDAYQAAEARFWTQLDHFVATTQAMPVCDVSARPVEDPAAVEARQRYAVWRKRQSLQEIDAQLLAERMVLTWKQRPGIHLLMAVHPGEEALLADTLDSLAAQLYPEWLLTVATVLPTPEGLADIPNLQWLALRDAAHIDYVLGEMAAASPGTWLARIDPGLTLEPHTLQVVADYINLRPDWRLIYTDEDTREPDGSYTQPCFKPDFNLDLLRAQAYFGSFVVVAKDAFLAAGRYGSHAGAENYDLALRVLDRAGEAAIGHIDQMLAHLPRASRRTMNPAAEKAALADHFARNGIDATIHDGASFGTRRVQYRWTDAPLVSIVIQTRDREEYLRPLIDSIATRTDYPNYEIVVVDNDSTDPDALAYLHSLATEARWAGRCRVVACPGEFSHARGANTGAAAAQGDYLLFLDNDTHVVQDEWLDRLMDIAMRPDVGIVGPRLTYPETAKVQHTGWVLGLRGSAGSPWNNDLEITDPGYMARALCDQNVGAVCGSALLVRRSLFDRLGGIDADGFPLSHGTLDLCLRAREAGARIVWTPYSMLVHFDAISLKARQRKPDGMLADLLGAMAANDRLLERWLPRLAHDPAYNRNLSLADPFKPEHVAPIDWDIHFHDRPRILGVPLTGGAGEYRLRAPLRAIGQAGLAQTMICEPPKAFSVRILSPVELARAAPDAIILHQPLDDPQTDALEAYKRFLPQVRRIITIDDLITALPKKNSFYKAGFKDARPRLRRTLGLADRLVVSTRPLADLCADMIDEVRIMPNCLEGALWNDIAPPRLPRSRPRVGWAGAQQHLGDLELIYPVVEALADEVDWIFMGMCPEPLKPFVHESHGFVQDFRAYPAALARLDLDLAIAPLEIHPFNECKSNLRLLEYGAMGWPVICTDIYPYQNAPVTRLPNDPEKWIGTIREQLADPAALQQAGRTLQAWVRDGFILENHATSWFSAYGP